MFGNPKDKGKEDALFKDSSNKVHTTMPNETNNVNSNISNTAQQQTSHNSSHNSPPSKNISDGFGGMKPNPEYENYRNNRPIISKISDFVKEGGRNLWNTVKDGKFSLPSLATSMALSNTQAGSILDRADTVTYASYGATIGSFVPVVGTAVGGFVGGAVGFAKDVYDGDVKAAWNWATGNKPATSSNIASPSGNPFLGNTAQAYVSNYGATSSNNLEELRSVIGSMSYTAEETQESIMKLVSANTKDR